MAGIKLIAAYIGFVLIGELIAYGAGRIAESVYPVASLPIFLSLFFLTFWAGWKLAVRFA